MTKEEIRKREIELGKELSKRISKTFEEWLKEHQEEVSEVSDIEEFLEEIQFGVWLKK